MSAADDKAAADAKAETDAKVEADAKAKELHDAQAKMNPTGSRVSIKPTEKLDKTIPGGRYINAQGKRVNAHGQPIDEDGHVTDGSETPQQEPPR